MCLTIDNTILPRKRAALRRDGRTRAWKIYTQCTKCLASPYRGSMVFRAGPVVSSREQKKLLPEERKLVDVGIHVYLSRKNAQEDCLEYNVVVPVTCHARDLVGWGAFGGDPSAVFMKVHLSARAFKKAIAEKKK